MKKLGFTLTEALLALAIIGVIAALTIPNVTLEHRKQTFASSLAAAVSDFETGMSMMILRDGAEDLTGTSAWKYALRENEGEIFPYSTRENVENFTKNIKKYFKIDCSYKNGDEFYKDKDGNDIDVKEFNNTVLERNDGFYEEFLALEGRNNIAYLISIPNAKGFAFKSESDIMSAGGHLHKIVGELHIDVNGIQKPNTIGRDIFFFKIGIDGILYPYGGKDYGIWSTIEPATWQDKCNNSITDARYCTGRLVENGYKMDY